MPPYNSVPENWSGERRCRGGGRSTRGIKNLECICLLFVIHMAAIGIFDGGIWLEVVEDLLDFFYD